MSDENSLADFMSKKTEDKDLSSKSVIGSNKTQEALDKSKEDKEEADKKALEDAKKESMAKASRYSQANLVQAEARHIIKLLPFIIFGVVVFLIIFFKGGEWLQAGMHKFLFVH